MRRNVRALTEREYDLIVVGGGIFGICAAWDAVLRGLSVALLERGDFAEAASANCFKMVHGGIRYLQHGDLYRVRESSRERGILLQIAPHHVRPLPILVPTYGHGLQGMEILKAGALLYDLLTLDRNRGIYDPYRLTPCTRSISRQECLRLFPGLDSGPEELTGAVLIHDGQIYSPARLALSFLRSAVDQGAEAVNYLEATDFLQDGDRLIGVKAVDRLAGAEVDVRGQMILNAAGPWAERLLDRRPRLALPHRLTFSRDAFFVVGRPWKQEYGLAIKAANKDPDAILSRGHRHLFLLPWREHTLVGVWHGVHDGHPDDITVTAEDLERFVGEVNAAYQALELTVDDISLWNAGLILFGENRPGAVDLSYGKRSHIIDHAREHEVEGIVTLIGVRYTTARGVAEKAVDMVFRKLGKEPPKSRTAVTPIWGGRIERMDDLLHRAVSQRPRTVSAEAIPPLVQNHGSAYQEVLRYVEQDPTWGESLGTTKTIRAEVLHAVREEMAQTLADVVFRRTDVGTGGHPGETALKVCADLMASELGWSESRRQQEIEKAAAIFPRFARREPRPEQGVLSAAEGGQSLYV